MKIVLKTLDELGDVRRGKSKHRPRDAAHLYDGPYPFIQTSDVKNADLYITEYTQTYSAAGLAQSILWKAGTLCITIAANIADTAILSFDSCFPDSIIGFIPDTKKSDARYIKYLFDAVMQQRFKKFTQGAAQDNLSQEKLLSLKLPVAEDVNGQKAIADRLAIYDDLIDINRRRIRLLEEAARLLFREWFVYFRFPGHEKFKIVDGMPEGWERVHLEYLVETQYGYTETATDEEIGPKFLRGTDINKNSYIDWSAVPYCTEQGLNFEKYALSKDDIVVIRMADPGKVAIIEKNIKAIFASYLVRLKIKPNTPLLPYFLFYKLSNEQYQGFIANASTGSTRQSASAKLLVNFHFVLPPLSLQEMFNDYIIPLRAQMNTLLDQNAALKKARDLLLPRLMSGRIYPVR